MFDEFIDILNNDLTVLKTCLKTEVHTYGHLHASVHIWFYTNDCKLLIQKRSSNKIAFPNLWDVSVAGHISTGETSITGAIREVKEEIGLDITANELLKIGSFKEQFQHKDDFTDNEIHHIYLCKLTKDINLLKIQKEEVSQIKLIPIDEFKDQLKKHAFENVFVPHYPEYYDFILTNIDKQVT
ncbi:MAG: NUDIX hydrolase [Lutibacter sp.]|nr:MAG: NUDIX hydrolase [Lutibacter sp.]